MVVCLSCGQEAGQLKSDLNEALDALEMMWMLVMNEVPPKAFENGVTDSTGSIDEGMVRASNILGDVEGLLREHGKIDYVGRGPR